MGGFCFKITVKNEDRYVQLPRSRDDSPFTIHTMPTAGFANGYAQCKPFTLRLRSVQAIHHPPFTIHHPPQGVLSLTLVKRFDGTSNCRAARANQSLKCPQVGDSSSIESKPRSHLSDICHIDRKQNLRCGIRQHIRTDMGFTLSSQDYAQSVFSTVCGNSIECLRSLQLFGFIDKHKCFE